MEELSKSSLSSSLYKEITNSKVTPGIFTNSKTRPLMIDSLYSYITEFPLCVKSKRLALELTGLAENKNGKIEGDGTSDDLVLATSFAFYVRKYDPPLLLRVSNKNVVDDVDDVLNLNFRGGRPKGRSINYDIKQETIELMEKHEISNQNPYVNVLNKYFDMESLEDLNSRLKHKKII